MSWDRLALIEPPVSEVITLDEAKKHLREESGDSDELISALIAAARGMVEGPNGIGLALLTQTWRLNMDRWPCRRIDLLLTPVQDVGSIVYIDQAGAEQTLDAATYKVNAEASPAHVELAYGRAWPPVRRETAAIKIQFVAGYGDTPEDVPGPIKAAMLLIIGHLYQNREATAESTLAEMPLGANALLDPYRVGQFS